MAIQLDRLLNDFDWSQEKDQPETRGVFIPGKRGKMLSKICIPGGSPKPYPTILFCHGIPGVEQLGDYCFALRQAGFCTVQFHYSGSWGSDGDYSVGNCMEDTASAVEYLLRNEDGLFDQQNLFVAGHSMGGLMAVYALAQFKQLKAGAVIMPGNMGGLYLAAQQFPEAAPVLKAVFDDFGASLQNFSWDVFREEAAPDPKRFCLDTYAPAIAARPVLAIAGAMDTDLPRAEHIDLLAAALLENGEKQLREVTVPTTHMMDDQRDTIKKTLGEFFAQYVK